MFGRNLKPLKSNSFFLFGARATGKSTLLREFFQNESAYFIDLLREDQYLSFATNLNQLSETLKAKKVDWVIIDEVQKIPKLLDEVHKQIFEGNFKFALTGSSAAKLKRGKANMLAGRAFVYNLYPLTHRELGASFDLNNALSWGTLPDIYRFTTDQERQLFLSAYTSTYIKEEVALEQLIRKVIPFQKFLPVVGQVNGQILNFSNIARDVGVDADTVKNYFSILEDTLLGFFLEAHDQSIRKRQRLAPKFYLFDTGIVRSLQGLTGQTLTPSTCGYGNAFEHFIILEIYRLASYSNKSWRFSYLRSSNQAEIDLIIERPGMPTALVEIKSSRQVDSSTINLLAKFKKDFSNSEAIVLCQESQARISDGVEILPWLEGLIRLGL
jgi:predicted AAA+ superfamily ATPase